mmetsp:Transcript_140893/g.245304  ORF Transcript_140893/g.245304 Transcript_140893/m.245304 type:complete len:178 (+) Transcript_140893:166-699(+)
MMLARAPGTSAAAAGQVCSQCGTDVGEKPAGAARCAASWAAIVAAKRGGAAGGGGGGGRREAAFDLSPLQGKALPPPSKSLHVTTFRQAVGVVPVESACGFTGLVPNKPMVASPAEVRREKHEADSSSSDHAADTVLAEPEAALVEAVLLTVLALRAVQVSEAAALALASMRCLLLR